MATPTWKKEEMGEHGKRFVRLLVHNRRGDYVSVHGQRYKHWPWPWVRMPFDYAKWLAEPWRRIMRGPRIERMIARARYWVPALGLRTYAKHVVMEGFYKLLEHDRREEVGAALHRARQQGVIRNMLKPRYQREHRNWRDYLDEDV